MFVLSICGGPFDMCVCVLVVSYATVTDQVQYFIRNTSMVVTKIEGSGNGARVYVVSF